MKQGPRSSPRDQGGIQNYATGTISSNNVHQRISSPRATRKQALWVPTPKPLLKGHAKNGLGKNTHYGGTLCDWKTTLHLNIANGSLTSRSVSITRGIIQGGSLSPLLFCLALLPPPRPSTLLNESSHGYEINGQKVTHLFYTNDLKTYARDDKHQTCLLKIFKIFRDGIQS